MSLVDKVRWRGDLDSNLNVCLSASGHHRRRPRADTNTGISTIVHEHLGVRAPKKGSVQR
jgi:hypothetical protein